MSKVSANPKIFLRTITSTNLKNTNEENVVDNNKPGIYAVCKYPRCYICKFKYIENCTSFVTSNNTKWEIRSHINCNRKNVIYYLQCNMCNGQVTKTGKTETKLRARINNHISNSETGRTSDVFDLHVQQCGKNHNGLVKPYFKVRA